MNNQPIKLMLNMEETSRPNTDKKIRRRIEPRPVPNPDYANLLAESLVEDRVAYAILSDW